VTHATFGRTLRAAAPTGLFAFVLLGAGCATEVAHDVTPQHVAVKLVDGLEASPDGAGFAVHPGVNSPMDATEIAAALPALDASLRGAGVVQVRRMFDVEGEEGSQRIVDGHDVLLYFLLELPPTADAAAAGSLARVLTANPLVAEAHLQPTGQPIDVDHMGDQQL
jgi:hypothetical protein